MSAAEVVEHLSAAEVAAYVDGKLRARSQVQAHLAECADCRAEWVEVARIVRTLPGVRSSLRVPRAAWMTAAAAASLVLLVTRPWSANDPAESGHRDGVVTTIVAPQPVAPEGVLESVRVFIWSAVPLAQDYRVRLFDHEGTVIWQKETADTLAALPTSIGLRSGVQYYWRVEARTGFDRQAASDLVEFTISPNSR